MWLRAPTWLTCVSLLAGIGGCGSCSEGDAVAQLALSVARVERDSVGREAQWRPAEVGTRLRVGEGIRTGEEGRAELRLLPEGRLRVESSTVVRFTDTAPGTVAPRLALETGRVELEADEVGLEINTPLGVARVARGSRVSVARQAQKLRFEVRVGRIEIERPERELAAVAGEGFVIDVGTLVVESLVAAQEQAEREEQQAVDATRSDAGDSPAAELAPGDALSFEPAPSSAHVTLPAGESATVHDPKPPTHVGIECTLCRDGFAVEVARGGGSFDHLRVRAQRVAVLRLPPGSYRYRVRCFEAEGSASDAVAKGRIVVQRDGGTRRLPRTPPAAEVDLDGRRYTVRYQNLLPKLSVRWPNAPTAPSYVLQVQSPSGKRLERRSERPVVLLSSGELGEGVHELAFRAGPHSVRGSLRIAFDNAATTAYLSAPKDGEAEAGQSVRVAGAALQGSAVRVTGRPVSLSPQGRFGLEVPVPADGEALWVRVQNATTGIHYYLRRLAP